MAFIELHVRTTMLVHGYDSHNKEIIEKLDEPEFTRKLVAIERIQSISDQYLLVSAAHGRTMYWEYQGDYAALKHKLARAGAILA